MMVSGAARWVDSCQLLMIEVIGSVLTVLRDLDADTTLYRKPPPCIARCLGQTGQPADSQDQGRSRPALIRSWRTCTHNHQRRSKISRPGCRVRLPTWTPW